MNAKLIFKATLCLLGAGTFSQTAVAQDIYDDIYGSSEPQKSAPKPQPTAPASYPAADTYNFDSGSTRSVDEYNRRGIFAPADTTVSDAMQRADSLAAVDFNCTRQIERYYNPDVVVGSSDADLAQLYYSQPANINIIINTPGYYDWGWPYYSPYSPWGWSYSSYWGWNSYWGPSWNWAWGPGWGWGPSWSWGWWPGWGPGAPDGTGGPVGAPDGARAGAVPTTRVIPVLSRITVPVTVADNRHRQAVAPALSIPAAVTMVRQMPAGTAATAIVRQPTEPQARRRFGRVLPATVPDRPHRRIPRHLQLCAPRPTSATVRPSSRQSPIPIPSATRRQCVPARQVTDLQPALL